MMTVLCADILRVGPLRVQRGAECPDVWQQLLQWIEEARHISESEESASSDSESDDAESEGV